MSGLDPEFQLVELDLPEKVLARIERIRNRTMPKPVELAKLREQAELKGVIQVNEHELVMKCQAQAGLYTLEHSQTKAVLGMVGFNSMRQREYRLLWLIDGRTIETVQVGRTESYMIYADGFEIGSFDILRSKKFFFLFTLPCEWSIRIGDIDAIRMRLDQKSGVRIHLDFPNNESVPTWVGQARQASSWDQLLQLFQRTQTRKSSSPNTMWFLPRDEHGQKLGNALEERVALMAFALLLRSALIEIRS